MQQSKMVRVADYVMQRLNVSGINHIFMVTGRGALFLTDAVAKHNEMSGVCMHNEQAASYAAVAYAQYTGELGACLVSTGCAGTNTITGVLNAWQDGIPCVFISGQNKLHETSRYTKVPVRTYGQQEADIVPIVESITKYSVMITDPRRIVYELGKAIYLSQNGRKGPVWVDIPLDVQNMPIRPDELERFIPEENFSMLNLDDVKYVSQLINESQRPVLLIGSGIKSAGASEILEEFVNSSSIPVTYSGSSPDIVSAENSLTIGSVGMMGCTRAANFTVQNSDLLLVLGNRLSSMITGADKDKFARNAKIIVVDIDDVEHTKNTANIDRLIKSDVKLFLEELLKENIKKTSKAWIDKCLHWKKIFPKCEESQKTSDRVNLYYLSDCLSKAMTDESVFISDSGLIEVILPTNISFKKKQHCIHPASQGAMGVALPAVVGAHFASKNNIVAVVGDGSIMMNLQELETIRYNKIPAKILVVNNNAYSVIRHRQEELFRSRTIGTDPSNGVSIPEFKKVADCFGFNYTRIDNSAELSDKLDSVLKMDGPVICEIMSLEEQEYISSSYTRNSEGRIVVRPIEDQAPFLDRDLFLSEMIIEPIDQ